MELQEFIEKTISDVTNALHNSSNKMAKDGVGEGIPQNNSINIKFDIAVTVNDTAEQSANAKIAVLGNFGLGGNVKSGTDKQQVSRLSFEIPVKIKTNYSSRVM